MSSSVSVKSDWSKDSGPNFSGERAKQYLMYFICVYTDCVNIKHRLSEVSLLSLCH